MRIDELDEFQGLTPGLVTDWLLANGWQQTKPRWWERGEDGFLFDSETFDQQWFWTHALAAIYTAGNVQGLLCKINPRMRKGMPSQAARDAHMGAWVGHMGGEFPLVTIGHWATDGSIRDVSAKAFHDSRKAPFCSVCARLAREAVAAQIVEEWRADRLKEITPIRPLSEAMTERHTIHLPVIRYRDKAGNPTCAADFERSDLVWDVLQVRQGWRDAEV